MQMMAAREWARSHRWLLMVFAGLLILIGILRASGLDQPGGLSPSTPVFELQLSRLDSSGHSVKFNVDRASNAVRVRTSRPKERGGISEFFVIDSRVVVSNSSDDAVQAGISKNFSFPELSVLPPDTDISPDVLETSLARRDRSCTIPSREEQRIVALLFGYSRDGDYAHYEICGMSARSSERHLGDLRMEASSSAEGAIFPDSTEIAQVETLGTVGAAGFTKVVKREFDHLYE